MYAYMHASDLSSFKTGVLKLWGRPASGSWRPSMWVARVQFANNFKGHKHAVTDLLVSPAAAQIKH